MIWSASDTCISSVSGIVSAESTRIKLHPTRSVLSQYESVGENDIYHMWTPVSSMGPDVDWCTATGCMRTRSHTQRSGMASFLVSCPVCAGPWPSPGSLTCGYLFRRREHHLAMYQMTVFQGVLLGRTGRVRFG